MLNVDIVIPKVKVSLNEFGEEKSQTMKVYLHEEKKDELHYGVFRKVMIVKDDTVLRLLKGILFGDQVSKPESDEEILYYCDTDFYKGMTCSIKDEIEIYMDDQLVNNLTDLVFSEPGKAEHINKWLIGNYEYSIGRCIFERSYPSAETSSAFHFVSIVMPDRGIQTQNDFDQMKRLLKVDAMTDNNRYDTAKGSFLFSILQGASVSSISQVKDIKIPY